MHDHEHEPAPTPPEPVGPAPAGGAPRPPRHRVAPRARAYWFLRRATVLVVVLAATLVPAALWEGGRPWLVRVAVALAALLVPGLVVAPWLRYRTHRWEATGTAVYSRTGWIGRQWRVAPLSRVQTVEAKRNVLHRVLGLAAVSVTTGSASGAVVLEGLDAQVAEDLVLHLTDAVAATRGDAT
ncbi:PH domain-containing protein [Cellulomonas bogoriensis]|uniref:Membrane protein n=1 Tax=Cellulomonas bogoriensis 69B4 = DSM 16987 TaxID=1386082 RepID=A0A0A0BZT3_9CELL|nr:PH domain-containing protein [Cellulomonas bogoriensis]KGM13455.1 membrane protein [Cellulomonas bogoriensis 69B4 = DSM 16987]